MAQETRVRTVLESADIHNLATPKTLLATWAKLMEIFPVRYENDSHKVLCVFASLAGCKLEPKSVCVQNRSEMVQLLEETIEEYKDRTSVGKHPEWYKLLRLCLDHFAAASYTVREPGAAGAVSTIVSMQQAHGLAGDVDEPNDLELSEVFKRPSKRQLDAWHALFTKRERKLIDECTSPDKVTSLLESFIYTYGLDPLPVQSTLNSKKVHCFGGALVALYCVLRMGYEACLLGWDGYFGDDGHAVCVYRSLRSDGRGFLYGTVGKSSFVYLRSRSCAFRSVYTVVATYFDHCFNTVTDRRLTLKDWSLFNPFNAGYGKQVLFGEQRLNHMEDYWNEHARMYRFLPATEDPRENGTMMTTATSKTRTKVQVGARLLNIQLTIAKKAVETKKGAKGRTK